MHSHLILTLPLPLSFHNHKPRTSISLSTHPLSLSKIRIRCSLDREEHRWLREEQRWLREEQRWLREEQRWNRERDALLSEIRELRARVEELQLSNNNTNTTSSTSVAGLLKGFVKENNNKSNLIAESGSSSRLIEFEGNEGEKEESKEVVVEEKVKRRKTLRVGAEGDEVREMQEALLKLGFYSGEEDMEFSSFASGTERAVKTWQSTFGGREDGIMTEDLLERLYMEQLMGADSDSNAISKEGISPISEKDNGAAIPYSTAIPEVQQKDVKEEGATEFDASKHRVFLLGENRWEEPSRLAGRDKQAAESKTNSGKTQCLTCRGEGRLLCMECDGTGDPNIEPQFLEWIDENAKCPYCEGMGYTTCEVCDGKKLM